MPDRSKRGFSDRSVDRIIDVVRRAEALPVYELGSEGPANGDVPHPLEQWVKVTSLTQTAGRYPGQWYDDRVKPWVAKGSVGDIWVVAPNSEGLSLGVFYRGNVCQLLNDGKLVFNVVAASDSFAGTFTLNGAVVNVTNASITFNSGSVIDFDSATIIGGGGSFSPSLYGGSFGLSEKEIPSGASTEDATLTPGADAVFYGTPDAFGFTEGAVTISVHGYYRVEFIVLWSTGDNASGDRYAEILFTGDGIGDMHCYDERVAGGSISGHTHATMTSDIQELDVSDSITFLVNQDSGSPIYCLGRASVECLQRL